MDVVLKRPIIMLFLLVTVGFVPQAKAQTRPITGEEYLRSLSEQARDRSLTGPRESGVQRAADIAALPPLRSFASPITVGFMPKDTANGVNRQSEQAILPAQIPTGSNPQPNAAPRYLYPAQSPPAVVAGQRGSFSFAGNQTFTNSNPTIGGTNPGIGNRLFGSGVTNAAMNPPAPAASYSMPTSVLAGPAQPMYVPNSTSNPNYSMTNYPQSNVLPPTINPLPSVGYGSPMMGFGQAPTEPAQNLWYPPQSNTAAINSAPQPGSLLGGGNLAAPTQIAPQPIYPPAMLQTAPVSSQNLPPGTSQGIGLSGQPINYVDGQPVRNLLRYIFPL